MFGYSFFIECILDFVRAPLLKFSFIPGELSGKYLIIQQALSIKLFKN